MTDNNDYKSSISARTGYTRQATGSSASSSNRVLRIVTEMGSHTVTGISPSFGAGAASSIIDHREKEKKDLQDLNDRLAGYIEKVRFLEAQNRKLAADLDMLRGKWGKDTSSIKNMYEGELAEARKLIDETSRDKAAIESQISRLQQDLHEYRKKYEETNRLRDGDKEKIEGLFTQLSDAEAEISLLRRRIQSLEDEVNRLKNENGRLLNELQKARSDLDQETLNRIDYQNQVQTLLEEIDFLNRVHDQEIRELQSLATRDTTSENREYFKNELAMAIRDIRNEYDAVTTQNKVDMESWYKLKVQEIQSSSARSSMETSYQKEETKRLRMQLGDLRGKLSDLETRNMVLEKQVQELSYQLEDDQRQYEAALNDRDGQIRKMREECQALMIELQMLLDTKQTLDAEIAIYRKMLEGEENRDGLKQLVDQMVRTHSSIISQEDTDAGGDVPAAGSGNRRVSYRKKTQQEGPEVTVEESYREDPNKGEREGGGEGEAADHERTHGTRRTDSTTSGGSKYGHVKPGRISSTGSTGSLRHQGFGDLDDKSSIKSSPKGSISSPKGSIKSSPKGSVISSPEEEKHESFEESMRVVKGEMATRTSFQRSAKGNVSIAECHPDGKYIVLENTHRSKDENLDEWKLKRKLDGKREIVFTLPPKFVLKAGKSAKIWANNQGGANHPPDQLVFDGEDSWGTGHNVQTILYNKDGEERATHIQKTSQQTSATT